MSLVCVGVDVHDICKTLPEDVLLGVSFPPPYQTKLDCFCATTNGRRRGTPCGSALSKLPVINMKFAQNRHFYKVSTANITYHTGAYRRYGIWCREERKLPHIGFAQNVKWLKTECGHSTTFPSPSLSHSLSCISLPNSPKTSWAKRQNVAGFHMYLLMAQVVTAAAVGP